MPPKQGSFKAGVYRDSQSRLRTDASPLFLTYFMVDWGSVSQSPTTTRCLSCGGEMSSSEPVRDKKGAAFDGLVCHRCKTVLWTRRS